MKHPNIRNYSLEYRFFFFFFDFFFSRRGEGEGLSELLTVLHESQIFFCHEHISIHIYFFTCLCSYFSFSSSDCASLEENQTLLNLPTIWGRKGIRPWVKGRNKVDKKLRQSPRIPPFLNRSLWRWKLHLDIKTTGTNVHIFLLLQLLSLQTFLLSLLLLFLLAVRVEGRTIYIVARNAKSCTKAVILLLVGCS